MSKTKIQLVAEIGCNHMGQINLAKLMIDHAKQAGADYVKFQKRDNKILLSKKQRVHWPCGKLKIQADSE